MNDKVHVNDAIARPGTTTDNVNIQDSASHAYSPAGQADFIKASASGKDSSAGALPGLTITNEASSSMNNSQSDSSGGGQYEKATDDPYTRQAIARIFNQTAPSSYGGDSCMGGGGEAEEEEPQHEASQARPAADGTAQTPSTHPKVGGGNSTVKSMMQAERTGNVAQQSQNRSVASV